MKRGRRPQAIERPPERLLRALLAWYDRAGRTLPWRVRPEDRARGVRADPYRVWLSEVMLQQTTAATAAPYYARFLDRYPRVEVLAGAPLEDVLAEWAGLGYYARARNLHACAKAVAAAGGRFPDTEDGLRALPGVGPYTAAAVAAVCFDRRANVVDGNVERVIARLFAVTTPLPAAKPELRSLAAPLVPPARPGDHAQALMDLGATVCTPRNPACGACPWSPWCAAFRTPDPTVFPVKAKKSAKPVRRGVAYFLRRGDAVWLRRRAPTGLLGGMVELPTTDWVDAPLVPAPAAPARAAWRDAGAVRHAFSHFALELSVKTAEARADPRGEGWWHAIDDLDRAGLSSVMLKAARRGTAPS